MKTYNVQTRLSPQLVKEFEEFYDSMCIRGAERRLRDMLIEFAKTDSAKEDDWVSELMFDMRVVFSTIDACYDQWRKEQDDEIRPLVKKARKKTKGA